MDQFDRDMNEAIGRELNRKRKKGSLLRILVTLASKVVALIGWQCWHSRCSGGVEVFEMRHAALPAKGSVSIDI